MSIGIYFDGRRLIRPQAATKIDDSGMYARGLGGGNTLALIGECTGGEPGVVQWFTDPSYAKTILRGGALLQAVQRAYDPSSEVNGAYLVGAIRVNPALQSYLTLTDSSYNPLVVLESLDYGIWNNQIKARVESGTTSGTKKLTLTYGTSYDQGDNIERKSIYLGCADANALTATLTITQGTSTKTLVTAVTSTIQYGKYPDSATTWAPPTATPFTTFATDSLYLGFDIPFSSVAWTTTVANDVAASNLLVTYWNGSSWASVTGYADTTIVGGITLAQTGVISWTLPSNWIAGTTDTTPALSSAYWIRIRADKGLKATTACSAIKLGSSLSVNLSSYSTIQQLVDYLDAQPHYEAYVATSSPDTDLSTQLDACSATDFLSASLGNTTLTAAYTSGRILTVAATTNFGIGDYITVSRVNGTAEEMRRITAIGTLALTIDSALSTTYTNSPASVVREAVTLKSDVQAIIDWVNNGNTGYVTASYPVTTWAPSTAYIVGSVVLPSTANDRFYVCSVAGTSGSAEPTWNTTLGATQSVDGTVYWVCRSATRATIQNIPDTYLAGGSEGVTSQTNWDNALSTLQAEDVQLLSCVSYDPAVWAALSSHCSYMSTVGKKERIGFCGGFATADGYVSGLGKWTSTTLIANSITQMETYAGQLNTDRMVYVGPGFKAYDENGLLVTYAGHIGAALVAGMAAGVDVAEALTHKTIKVIGLEYNLKWANLDGLLELGVCPLEYEPGFGYRVCQSITTWLQNDKYNRRELSVRRTADYIARQVRDRLERDFVGSKGTMTTLISIKNATISVLQQMYRAELLAGDATNPPYKNIQCRLEGDTCWVDFECSPVIPINYIPITIHLTVYTATLTA